MFVYDVLFGDVKHPFAWSGALTAAAIAFLIGSPLEGVG